MRLSTRSFCNIISSAHHHIANRTRQIRGRDEAPRHIQGLLLCISGVNVPYSDHRVQGLASSQKRLLAVDAFVAGRLFVLGAKKWWDCGLWSGTSTGRRAGDQLAGGICATCVIKKWRRADHFSIAAQQGARGPRAVTSSCSKDRAWRSWKMALAQRYWTTGSFIGLPTGFLAGRNLLGDKMQEQKKGVKLEEWGQDEHCTGLLRNIRSKQHHKRKLRRVAGGQGKVLQRATRERGINESPERRSGMAKPAGRQRVNMKRAQEQEPVACVCGESSTAVGRAICSSAGRQRVKRTPELSSGRTDTTG